MDTPLDIRSPGRRTTALHYALIVALAVAFFVPFLGRVHLFDWDEANFAEAAREMLATGDYMRVTIDYRAFWEKPPLFFWLQALSMSVFGVNEFGARFVNALCGILTLCIAYAVGKRLYDWRFGLLWALAFLGSFLPHLFYKSGIIDPVFNLFIFVGLSCCIGAMQSEGNRRLLLYGAGGVSTGLAVLSKGPVGFLLVALCMGVYWASRRFRVFFTWKDITAYLLAMAAVAFVFFGVETIGHGPWFITEFLKYQLRLLTTGDAGHGRPFYFHFVVVLFGCFPASFFAIRSLLSRPARTRSQDLYNTFMLILLAVVMVLFSLVRTKTVLYSSLSYFPLTYLAALHMYDLVRRDIPVSRRLLVSLTAFSLLIAATITAFPLLLLHKESVVPLIADRFARACLAKPVVWYPADAFVGIGYATVLVAALLLLRSGRHVAGLATLFLSSAVCLNTFMYLFAPRIEAYTQADAVEFFRMHAGGSVYVRALHKSYADLFYSRKPPGLHPDSGTRDWLLSGPIDRPALLVCRVTKAERYAQYEAEGLRELGRAYGYAYFRRDPQAPRPAQPGSAEGEADPPSAAHTADSP